MSSLLTIGQLAKAVGVNIQTIRYYERLNLLGPTTRKPSGYQLYGNDVERRLRFIKNAQGLGFTLHEIAELLNLSVSSKARCGDVQRKAETKLTHVEATVRDLGGLAKALRNLIRSCRSGQPTQHCPILKSPGEEREMPEDVKPQTRQ